MEFPGKPAPMKRPLRCLCLFLLALSLAGTAAASGGKRGITVRLRADESPDAPVARSVRLYDAGYALVIGIDDYGNGWPRLSNAVRDARRVAAELRKKGFEVTLLENLKSRELKDAFEKFFVFKGGDPEARLFAWFSGHGHTLDGEGYLVPADAPPPSKKEAFKYSALFLRRFGELVRQAESKHALAVFDACFSGTVFSTARAVPPPAVTMATTYPVREFISSGDADQEVSDDGRFRRLFIRALNGEEAADFNHDGYLTGTELGMFLADRIANLTRNRQTPRYGKLRDENYDRGDFVFLVASSGATVDLPAERPRKARLSVTANVAGAVVYLDGARIGPVPVPERTVTPGPHRVRVEKEGYDAYRTRVRVDPGRRVALSAYLTPSKPQTGRLYVETSPSDARVRILNIGPGYEPGMALSPGRYHLEASRDGYRTKRQWIDLEAGEDRYETIVLSPRPSPAAVPRPGETWREPVTGMEFVWVPGGCYEMGCGDWTGDCDDDERPVHEVCVDGFWLGRYEVTQGEWRRVMGINPAHFGNGGAYPVESVSWNDVQEFIGKLIRMTGKSFRLPTEAEWEYAARSRGKAERYAGGDDVDRVAWYKGNSGGRTHRVGTKAPNGLGLYDMSGNVWEWCRDWYGGDYYRRSPRKNPRGPSSGSNRVDRGGSWGFSPWSVRAASRGWCAPGFRSVNLGFRLALPQVSR